jgi:surface protein
MELQFDIPGAGGGASISVFAVGDTNPDFVLDWGYGSSVRVTEPGVYSVSYPATATSYTVTLTGTVPGFGVSDGSDDGRGTGQTYLAKVLAFGDVGLTSLRQAFQDAKNLVEVPGTLPTTVTDLSGAFQGAVVFNQDLTGWETSNVTTMRGMFDFASKFNGALSTWNTSTKSRT